ADRCTPGEFCDEHHLWLLQTTDGGQTWQLRSDQKDTVGRRVWFGDEQNGWLIGTKYKNWGVSPLSPFVLRTTDQGRHWEDVSGGINVILKEDEDVMRGPTHDD